MLIVDKFKRKNLSPLAMFRIWFASGYILNFNGNFSIKF